VLVFDYRNFGDSDGEPRQLVSIPGQLEDWKAAIAFARARQGIDAGRIGLWGTSFSGGHVVVLAADDETVRCVSSQCPMMDGKAASRHGLRSAGLVNSLKMSAIALRDLVGSALGMPPRRIAIVGKPGEMAALATPDAWDGYMALVPEGFRNEICARIALQVPGYRPVSYASKVKCPVLIQICEFDSVAPPAAAEEMASLLGDLAQVERYPIGHFEVYVGDAFERSVRDQARFFEKHLVP
jgi:pimeloyl-ACP methyl ester carboxylesterase